MKTLVLASFLALAAPAGAQATATGEWTARLNDSGWSAVSGERWIQLSLHPSERARSEWGLSVRRAELTGLPAADSYSGDARFALKRDAGTFDFEGTFKNGRGVGEYRFSGNPDYPAGMRTLGYAVEDKDIVRMALHDVSRDFAAGVQSTPTRSGDRPSVDDLLRMRIHGVTPEFIRDTRELGFKDLTVEQLVKMRIHRVTPEYVKEMRAAGFKDLTIEQLVKVRIHNVTPQFVKEIRDLGYTNLSLDDFVRLKIHNITPQFIKEVRDAGLKNMDADDLVAFSIHGGKKWLKKMERQPLP